MNYTEIAKRELWSNSENKGRKGVAVFETATK